MIYRIETGEPEDSFVAILQNQDEIDIKGLWKGFCRKYNQTVGYYPDIDDPDYDRIATEVFKKDTDYLLTLQEQYEITHGAHTLVRAFVAKLVKEHGFKELKFEEIHLDRSGEE